MQACHDQSRADGVLVLAVNQLEDDANVRAHPQRFGQTLTILYDRDDREANPCSVYGLLVNLSTNADRGSCGNT